MPTLSGLLNFGASAAASIFGAANSNGAQRGATKTLTAGGQQGINTIATGAQTATNTLQNNYQQQQAALQPFIAPGQQAATTLSNMKDFTPQTFNWTPANLANDPAYQFRLQQGQAGIEAAANAGGTRFSGATLKDLSTFNTGTAAQAENDDYNRSLGTFNTNENNQFSAYQTNLGRQQNLEAQGLQATGQQVSAGNQTAQSTAQIQTSSAQQIANLQTQIATAQAQGQTNQATTLQNTLNSLLNGAQQSGLLKFPGSTPSTNTSFPPAGSPNQNPQAPPGTDPNSLTDPYSSSPQGTDPNASQSPSGGSGSTAASLAGAGAAATTAALAGAGSTAASLTPVVTVGLNYGAGAGLAAGAGEAGATGASLAAPAIEAGTEAGAADASTAAGSAAAGAGGSGILSSVGAFLTNPITIGVGAALLAGYAIIKATQVHPTADKFVQNIQNPFGQHLSGVVDGFDKALQSGQLSKSDAQSMRDQTAQMLQQFQAAGQQFAAQGSKQSTVWKQAQQTMAQDFGPNYKKILSKMDSEIAALPQAA